MNRPVIESIDILVPARIINEYVYCPRLAYIEWIQADFSENEYTLDGKRRHRNVDKEKGELPNNTSDTSDSIQAKSVWLSSEKEKITTRIDMVEVKKGEVIVIEYKRGGVPDNSERSWESDRVQLCAQSLVLNDNGYKCYKGMIYYSESKTKVEVDFSQDLIAKTRKVVEELLEMSVSKVIPKPLDGSAKCNYCSLASVCLPDETNMLTGKLEKRKIRRLMPARHDTVPLYVLKQGAFLKKRGDLIEIWQSGNKIAETRIFETSQVCLFGNVQISTQVLRELCKNEIPIVYLSTGGWFYGITHGMTHKNIELRQAQFAAASDEKKRLIVARSIVATKIANSRTLLKRNGVNLSSEVSGQMKKYSESARRTNDLKKLLGIEGFAAKLYFSQFGKMIKVKRDAGKSQPELIFSGRNKRPPRDPVNALLSYVYALLVKDLTIILLSVGFDPFLGFYHVPRYGRPALALDLMEEFRPIIADSVVINVINNGIISSNDFVRRGVAVSIKERARRKLVSTYERRLDTLIRHQIFGYSISYRRIFEVQARLIGRFLAGEIDKYPAFRTR